MRTNDKTAFNEALTTVYSLYRVSLSADLLGVWWNALKAQNLSDVRKALDDHIADPDGGQFCPNPADVIKRIPPEKTANQLCDHCGTELGGWAKLGSGRVCSHCYRTYLDGEWVPERAA